jgi:hypothetical protein
MVRLSCSTFLVCAVVACHDDEPKPTPTATTPSGTLAALGMDASGIGAIVDPPRPAGDFKADIDAFTTLEDCMHNRAKVDPVIADALENIGYDTFVRDACRVLEAAKTKDVRRCTLIDASTLKARCNAVVAVWMHDANLCPRVSVGPDRGRDPMCLAQALRSPVLCAAVDTHDRTSCNATLTRDEKGCDAILITEERDACVRDVVRWRSTLADGAPQVTVLPPVKGSLEVHGAEGHPDLKTTNFDLGFDLSRGVVVVEESRRWRLSMGEADDLSLTPKATNPMSTAKLGFRLLFGPEASAKSELEGATLSVPGASSVACSTSKCELTIKTKKLESTRGGAVSLEVDGMVGTGAQAFKVHADLSTFVRDVMDLTAEQ